jgi:hypothetical protein
MLTFLRDGARTPNSHSQALVTTAVLHKKREECIRKYLMVLEPITLSCPLILLLFRENL